MAEARFERIEEAFRQEIERVEKAFGAYERFLLPSWRYELEAFDARPAGAENIVGFGVGEKYRAGRAAGRLCMKIYTLEKLPIEEVAKDFSIPKEIEGVETDVEQVGEIVALSYKGRYRPAPGGVSIGHPDMTCGTLGCFACDDKQPLLILSNNHVLANSNDAEIGDPIIQPGRADGGKNPRDKIAELYKFIDIDFAGKPNRIDAALAKPISSDVVSKEILNQGKVRGVAPPALGIAVKKSGRTTENTPGTITGTHATARVNYRGGIALFRDLVIITPGGFSAGGDSGSIIVDE